MSMLKKLKSIFVVEENVPQSTSSKGKTQDKPQSSSKSRSTVKKGTTSSSSKEGTSPSKNRFIDMLLKAIEANNIEGFDYLEYKQSLQSLVKLESDETKRFQSAFVMASTMGLNKKTLFKSAQRYADVLAEEEKKFREAFEKQKAAQVTNRENKIKTLQNSISTMQKEIKDLEAKIDKQQKELSSIEADVEKSMAKVQSTGDQFYDAYNLVLNQIKDDMDKIDKYISE